MRRASFERKTQETKISGVINIDGAGEHQIATGLGFLDHMLSALTRHAWFDLTLSCTGDLHVDDHHTVEDCAIAIGAAIDQCLEDRRGIARFGSAYAPLDEALARAVVDLSGRPHSSIDLGLTRDAVGDVTSENLTHFFQSLAVASKSAIHIDVLKGANDHHRVESAFKALALALRQALRVDGPGSIPSTKGILV